MGDDTGNVSSRAGTSAGAARPNSQLALEPELSGASTQVEPGHIRVAVRYVALHACMRVHALTYRGQIGLRVGQEEERAKHPHGACQQYCKQRCRFCSLPLSGSHAFNASASIDCPPPIDWQPNMTCVCLHRTNHMRPHQLICVSEAWRCATDILSCRVRQLLPRELLDGAAPCLQVMSPVLSCPVL